MKIVCSVLAFAALTCLSLSAQQITGNIRGTVKDPSGAVIRGAAVTIRQTETGLSRSTITDRNGNYVLLELPVGHYSLQVAAKGFQQYMQDGITLNVNETASVSPHLAVGSEKEQVLVKADAELIEPTVTSLGKVVQERELEDLPLNGRNFAQLGLLQPGVVPLTPGIAEAGGSLRNGQPRRSLPRSDGRRIAAHSAGNCCRARRTRQARIAHQPAVRFRRPSRRCNDGHASRFHNANPIRRR